MSLLWSKSNSVKQEDLSVEVWQTEWQTDTIENMNLPQSTRAGGKYSWCIACTYSVPITDWVVQFPISSARRCYRCRFYIL